MPRNIIKWTLIAWGFMLQVSAFAQTRSQVTGDSNTKQAQTLFVHADVGMTDFDSQAAESKETRASTSYELGGWLGESRVAGIKIRSQRDEVDYKLNQSKSLTQFTDFVLSSRVWLLTPSIGVSLSEVNVEKAGTPIVGLLATGINAGLGATGTLHNGITLNGNVMAVKNNRVYDKLSQETKLGDRIEADAHIAFDVTDRIVDLIVGYRARRFEIKTSEETFVEAAQGAYAGLRLGVYF